VVAVHAHDKAGSVDDTSEIILEHGTKVIGSGTAPKNDDFFPAVLSSFMMIIVSEIGDKTFFIAAILAMKQ